MFTPGAIAATLRRSQERDESRMVDRFVIDRPSTTGDVDDFGSPIVTYTKVYEGPGRISPYFPHGVPREVGASTVILQNRRWRIPAEDRMAQHLASGWVTYWSGPVQTDDRVRRVTDGKREIVGRVDSIDDDTTEQTAQRFIVEVGAR